MMHPVGQAHSGEGLRGDSPPLSAAYACIHQRYLHVSQHGLTRQQVELLKHEPYSLVAHVREFGIVKLRHILALKAVPP